LDLGWRVVDGLWAAAWRSAIAAMRWQRANNAKLCEQRRPIPAIGNSGEGIMTRFAIPLLLFILLVAFLAIGLRHDPHEVPSPLNYRAFQLAATEGSDSKVFCR